MVVGEPAERPRDGLKERTNGAVCVSRCQFTAKPTTTPPPPRCHAAAAAASTAASLQAGAAASATTVRRRRRLSHLDASQCAGSTGSSSSSASHCSQLGPTGARTRSYSIYPSARQCRLDPVDRASQRHLDAYRSV